MQDQRECRDDHTNPRHKDDPRGRRVAEDLKHTNPRHKLEEGTLLNRPETGIVWRVDAVSDHVESETQRSVDSQSQHPGGITLVPENQRPGTPDEISLTHGETLVALYSGQLDPVDATLKEVLRS